jgi:uncharacterized protein (DUF488 family)
MPGALFTIGHSNHPISMFLDLLGRYSVELVADTRSVPYSRFNPQYRQDALRRSLAGRGIRYQFFGRELGGKAPGAAPRGPAAPEFESGIRRLIACAALSRVAVLCAEEDPARCHRGRWIAPALRARGVAVTHIRGSGALEEDSRQLGLRF